jgi:hypothetical protein
VKRGKKEIGIFLKINFLDKDHPCPLLEGRRGTVPIFGIKMGGER